MEPHKARILKDFSEWFREAADEIGGTQVELAKVLGVTQEQVSRWKNGKFAPTLATMRDIAKRLKRPLPQSIIGREDSDAARADAEHAALKADYERLQRDYEHLRSVLASALDASAASKRQP